MRVLFTISILCLCRLDLMGQADSTANQGEIVSGEIVIEKDRKITLPKAEKVFQRGTPKKFDSDPIDIVLNAKEPNLSWPSFKADVPFKNIDRVYPESTYTNYLKLGYGNFNSPLAEVGVNEKLGSFDINSRVFYESFAKGPVNGSNSGSSQLNIDLAATYAVEKITVKPYLSFSNQGYRFYGNTNRLVNGFESNAEKVRWNDFQLGTLLKGKSGDFTFQLNPSFTTTNHRIKEGSEIGAEDALTVDGGFEYTIDKAFSAGFNLAGTSSTYKGGIDYDRSLFLLNPWLRYQKEEFSLEAGFNVATSSVATADQTGFYPNLNGELYLEENWTVYGGLSGGIDWYGLTDLLSQNEFLNDSLDLRNQETKFQLGGGIKGRLIKNLFLDVNIDYAVIDNLPVFTPSSSDSARYAITYDDENIERVTFGAELQYLPNQVATYGAEILIFGYSTSSLDRPWHLPAFEFKAYTSHNIQEKLLLSANVLAIGGIRSPTTVDFGITTLDTILDLGVGIKYLINPRASIFLDTHNLLNNEYERYLGYPVRGVNFKVGGQYRF